MFTLCNRRWIKAVDDEIQTVHGRARTPTWSKLEMQKEKKYIQILGPVPSSFATDNDMMLLFLRRWADTAGTCHWQ